ncbi:HNH endonuclease [Bacteroides clarus]|uniref:HNH endonuclease n=1 Tax=Bacteroides clarus TaxID=626929 RepID=UPI0021017E55|nr:HNH endonuclease signature motif containing protein [Bacteroides clarus]MCQ1546762.1 HNH endonuclease [Bacteroides clarus]
MDSEEPIYQFDRLKSLLLNMGIEVGEADAWSPVGTIDVLPEDIGTKIKFEDNGIFYFDDNGIKHQGFMYKRNFYFHDYGESMPKFHIRLCQTLQFYGKEAYRFANNEPIKIFARDKAVRHEIEVSGLQLCGYCSQILASEFENEINNSTDFVELLKQTENLSLNENGETEVDIFGYTKNWEQISHAFRHMHQFTCEHCGLQITEPFDQHFIHTHHKNGNKTDNRESNLECLCVRCHSEKDYWHKQRFSSGANRIILEDFNIKYPSK